MKYKIVRRQVLLGALAVLGSGVGATALSVVGASSASADVVVAHGASVEVCKASVTGTLAVTGPFTFHISNATSGVDENGNVVVNVGQCSNPIPVASASQTVITELPASWFSVASITAPPGANDIASSSLSGASATLNLASDTTSTVTFTNQLITGYIEVCKFPAPTSGLSGSYSFNITSGLPKANDPAGIWNSTVTVPVSSCSDPIQVPAANMTTTEAGTNLYVSSLTATTNGDANGNPIPFQNAIVSDSTTAGTAVVTVSPSVNPSIQTDVNYTDNVVQFKTCKAFWNTSVDGVQPGGSSTLYTFNYAIGSASVAGPDTAPASVSLAAGTCSSITTFRAGTILTVTEAVSPGTKVRSITDADSATDNAESVVPGSLSLSARTVTYVLGTPVTAGQPAPGNEVASTFENMAASPGELKICKDQGVGTTAVGTNFTFNYSGLTESSGGTISTTTGSVVVPIGSCLVVTNPAFVTMSNPEGIIPFMFNSNVAVTEVGSPNNVATSITTDSQFVSENVFGTSGPTLTTEPVLSGVTLGAIGASSSAVVTIGEDTLTELNVFNIDPPAGTTPVVDPGTPVATGTGVVVVAPAASGVAASSSLTVSGTSVSPSTSISQSTVGNTTTIVQLTAKQKAAELKSLNKTLSNVKAAIVRTNKLLQSHLTTKARKADVKHLSQLKTQENLINREIRLIK